MNNRMGLGLAVGAGYLLGRTKKAKLAFGIGTLVMGKRLQLNPRAIADFAAAQLSANPQFKEIGDQLKGDLRGVGKAATGAILNRQLEGLADRLHDRTLGVQDRMSGVISGETLSRDDEDEEGEEEEGVDEESDGGDDAPAKSSSRSSSRSSSGRSASGRSSSGRSSSRSSGSGTASKSRSAGGTAAKSASSKASTAKKTAKTATQRTAKRAPAKKTASRRTGKGGDDRG
ncbi:DNA primase [Streptomyces sp. NBC_00083]|uniref:DNA primase n=1 Tax=Streptomyces sp. NBC_00083 TaxID=2975647 RepID=UPI002258B352|nr:DNA primase [Streptomyces sp. NBC_00083]MCX5387100.1 type II toxin-antitoxin system RelE/ParE family toxin [Streptomyces sp. NBC_00083]